MEVYEEITAEVLSEPLPNLEVGIADKVKSDNIEIWYELIASPADSIRGTVLLIEGLAGTAIGWGEYTYKPILNAGYNVVRMDNRDVGRSTWAKNIEYDISDMATDVLAVVNNLGLDYVHIVGQSMGGMIAQEFALDYPERVKTLTLIYTSANVNDKSLPEPSRGYINAVIDAYSKYRKDDLASQVKLELALMDASNVKPLERQDLLFVARRTRYEIEKRKGKNKHASTVQNRAIDNSGSRYHRLQQIKIPVSIIHGKNDPLIPIEHGEKLASLIPHARTLWVEGYGHNIPLGFSKIIVSELMITIR